MHPQLLVMKFYGSHKTQNRTTTKLWTNQRIFLKPSSYPSVEKEAMAVVESVRHWRHLLAPRRFTLITDQRSVSFMFDKYEKRKIKNDKILRWRIELSTYNYKVIHRPGRLNECPDALSRVVSATTCCYRA